ncbi:MAG: PAS domain-containing protein [Candidatus Neomarinimicrobiota bacterium]
MTESGKMQADGDLTAALLDSMKAPVLFADSEHKVRYMNRAAIDYYERGEALLGTDLLECHNVQSQMLMKEILQAMQQGEEERLITDNEKHRIYMRAVRDRDGRLLGYYERYEPPVKMAGD